MNLLETESYDTVFGKKTTRKRPKLSENMLNYEGLATHAKKSIETYESDPALDTNLEVEGDGTLL
jgi:hypothetical protein